MAKGPLRIAIEDFIATYVSPHFSSWFVKSVESSEEEVYQASKAIIDDLLKVDGVPPELLDQLSGLLTGRNQGGIATLLGMGVGIGQGAAGSFLAPLFRKLNYKLDQRIHSARLDPPLASAAFYRRPEMLELAKEHMADLGYSTELTGLFFELFRPLVPEGDLLRLLLREEITEDDLLVELKKRGWDYTKVEQLVSLTHVIPPINDLIQMSVREAFNDEIAERFQYDADFPPKIAEFGAKQGLDA